MIYLNANRIFSTQRNTDPKVSLEILGSLAPDLSGTRLFYVIGEDSEACASYLSEALLRSGLSLLRCRANSLIDAKHRFLINGACISPAELCLRTEALSKRVLNIRKAEDAASGRCFDSLPLSCEELSFLLAADLTAERAFDAAIFEISEAAFESIISALPIAPLCAIFSSFSEKYTDRLIELLPQGTKAAVRYSDKACFDFISNSFSSNNIRTSTVSPNKITIGRITPYGTNFFYNSYPFYLQSVEKKDVIFASLAAEALITLSHFSELSVPYPIIYQGFSKASPFYSADLFSISPLVYTKISDSRKSDALPDSSLFEGKRIVLIRETDDLRTIIAQRDFDVAVILGSHNFIQSIKKESNRIFF